MRGLVFKTLQVERERKGCQVAETPIGVTDAGSQFDYEDEMQFAPAVMEDLFKNLKIWAISDQSTSSDQTLMKIVIGG